MNPWEEYQTPQTQSAAPGAQATPAVMDEKPWETYQGLAPSTNQQESGFVPTTEDLKSFMPKAKDILPLAGSTLGAVGRTTGTGALLAGIGAAGGEGYNQLLQRAGILSGNPPDTAGEAAKRMAARGATAAFGEVVGRKVVNPILKKAGNFIFSPADTEVQAGVQAAEEAGLKPLPSMIRDEKFIPGTQRALEYSPFGGAITKARQKMVEDFGSYAKGLGEDIGPGRDPETTGALVKEATKGYYDTFNEMKEKLYDSVLPQIKDNPVELTNTVAALEDIVKRNSGPARQGGSTFFADLLPKLKSKEGIPSLAVSGSPGEISNFSQLKQLGTDIYSRAKFFDPSNPGLQGDMKALSGAIMADKDAALEKYGDFSIKDALNKANDYFGIGKTILKGKVFKALTATPQGNEFKIAFQSKDPTAYDTVKEIVGVDNMGGMARQWYGDILKRSTKNDALSPQLLLNNLDKQQTLVSKMSGDFPEAAKGIDSLRKIATVMTRNSDVMQGSQTAPLHALYGILAEISASVANVFSHPGAAAAGIGLGVGALGATKAGTSFATSDFARNLLTRGYPAIQKGVEGTVNALAPVAAQAGAKGLLDENRKGRFNFIKDKKSGLVDYLRSDK